MQFVVRAGSVVAWWKGTQIALGVVAGEEKQRVRLVLSRGREARVPAARLVCEVEGPGPVPSADPAQRKSAGERADAAASRIRALAARVEVPLVWEIVSEERPQEVSTVAELAELALDASTGEIRAAVIVALVEDGVHFSRRGDDWLPRSEAAVCDLIAERRRVLERVRQQQAFLESVRGVVSAGGGFTRSGDETERRYLEALERLAVAEDEISVSDRDAAAEALAASGLRFDRPHEGAFRLLRLMGRFRSDDENLQLVRFGLRRTFSRATLEQAQRVEGRGFDRTGRRDLTELDAVSIDGPRTREIDDALSVAERPGGGHRLGVHIADPSAFVEIGDPIDREAMARCVSHYMPDLRLPMIPPEVSVRAASLVAGQERPALSFLVDLDDRGEITDWEVARSVVRCRARLDYATADRVLLAGDGEWAGTLRDLDVVGCRREQARVRAGAVLLRGPEVELYLGPDGQPVLERLEPDSASRRAVTEAMVLAGALAAIFTRRSGLPTIYRRQAAPRSVLDPAAASGLDPVALRQARFSLERAEVGLEPGRHHSLGLEQYTQVTSPIRRYQDLVTQRQIISALAGEEPAYDATAMQRILATTEQATADARKAERAAGAYWMLRYLGRYRGDEVDAIVVQVAPRPVVQLVRTLWEQPMGALAGSVEPGQAVTLRIERVNPRAGLLVLSRTD